MADLVENERISVETTGTETSLTIKVTFAAFLTIVQNACCSAVWQYSIPVFQVLMNYDIFISVCILIGYLNVFCARMPKSAIQELTIVLLRTNTAAKKHLALSLLNVC